MFVAVKDRDTKIANLETTFQDLRHKYYEMIQEVETSKALAMAIKQVAEEGAIVAHSTAIRKNKYQFLATIVTTIISVLMKNIHHNRRYQICQI